MSTSANLSSVAVTHSCVIQGIFSEESSNSVGIILKGGGGGDDYTHLSLRPFSSAPPTY